MTARLLVGTLAALRSALVYGEVRQLTSQPLRVPRLRSPLRIGAAVASTGADPELAVEPHAA